MNWPLNVIERNYSLSAIVGFPGDVVDCISAQSNALHEAFSKRSTHLGSPPMRDSIRIAVLHPILAPWELPCVQTRKE